MASNSGTGKEDPKINPKLPTWDGTWGSWADYKLQVELEIDSTSTDDLERLGPKLVRNLTGKAWEAITDIDRKKLKHKEGVSYLLTYLAEKRGRQKVDLLGEALGAYFQKPDVSRRDGEPWSDYETRHDAYIREINKALREIGSSTTVPTEIFGWFMLHQFLKLEPSDVATIKSVAATYKLEDIYTAMRRLWGGEALPLRDAERKKAKMTKTFMVDNPDDRMTTAWFNDPNAEDADQDENEPNDEEEDVQLLYEAALDALEQEPTNPTVLANFQEAKKMRYTEARKALTRARTSRGFYPQSGTRRNESGRPGSSSSGGTFTGRCMRCGKVGHKARDCRQQSDRPQGRSQDSRGAVGFVGFCAAVREESEDQCPLLLEEDLDHVLWEPSGEASVLVVQTVPEEQDTMSPFIGAAFQDTAMLKAVIDCGASESIVGDCMLQDYCEELERLGFDTEQEVMVDRDVRRNFLFGNSATSTALGLAKVTAGVCGNEVPLDLHVVKGDTPFLLSSRWLYDQEAVINFKTGKASFPKLSKNQIQLERAPSFHLLLPLTAFEGNGEVLQAMFVPENHEDGKVRELSSSTVAPHTEDGDNHPH